MDKIKTKKAKIAIVGLGYVGLPIATLFASKGFNVIGIELDKKIIESISNNKSPIEEPLLTRLLLSAKKNNKIQVTTVPSLAIKNANIILVCVQTPLSKKKIPMLEKLKIACSQVAENLVKGQLILIISTVPPKAMRMNLLLKIEGISELKCGRDFWLTYSPERIALGKSIQELIRNPKIVGGYDNRSTELAVQLWKSVSKGKIFSTNFETAEIVKLAENTFRDINIAYANVLALICNRLEIDVSEVIDLANTHPRVNIHRPGCGVGGPCLPKDPYFLLESIDKVSLEGSIIKIARDINDYMPTYVANLVVKLLSTLNKKIEKARIAVIGLAYKSDVGDTRNSPSKRIIQELLNYGTDIVIYDPYVTNASNKINMMKSLPDAVKNCDCVLITVNHKIFEKIKYEEMFSLMNEKPFIIDARDGVQIIYSDKN